MAADLLDPRQLALVGDRFVRRDQHLERDRFVAGRLDFDAVAAGVDAELLERAVEIVDRADEEAVHVYLAFTRLDLQAQRTLRSAAIRAAAGALIGALITARIAASVIAAVAAAIETAVVVRVVPARIVEVAQAERKTRVERTSVVARIAVAIDRIRGVHRVRAATAVVAVRPVDRVAGALTAVARPAIGRNGVARGRIVASAARPALGGRG